MFVPLTLAISRFVCPPIHAYPLNPCVPNSQIANIIGHQSLALHPPSYVCHRVPMLENQMQRDLGARSLQLQPLRMSHEGFLEGLRR